LDPETWWSKVLRDGRTYIIVANLFLSSFPRVFFEGVAIMGGSYGGYATLAGMDESYYI